MEKQMSRKRNMPSSQKVFDYWSNHIDVNKDQCFKCNELRPLERAHILAVSDGGSDDCDNIHLLCKDCHSDSEFLNGTAYDIWFNYPSNSRDESLMYITYHLAKGNTKPTVYSEELYSSFIAELNVLFNQ
jgi:hypothetical protein